MCSPYKNERRFSPPPTLSMQTDSPTLTEAGLPCLPSSLAASASAYVIGTARGKPAVRLLIQLSDLSLYLSFYLEWTYQPAQINYLYVLEKLSCPRAQLIAARVYLLTFQTRVLLFSTSVTLSWATH